MASIIRNPTSFDASSGTWDATTVGTINDFPDQTTYLTHGTSAGDATWNISAPTVPAGATNIVVNVKHYRYKSGSTCRSAGRIKIGSSYYNGSPSALTNGVIELHTETWNTNPATSGAWTPATANSIAAIGIYSSDANPVIRVYSVQLEITYDPPTGASSKAAYLKGRLTTSDNQTAYTYGDTNRSKKSAYLEGASSTVPASTSCLGYTHGSQNTTPGSAPAYLRGRTDASSSLPAYLSGQTQAQSSTSAFLLAINPYLHAYTFGQYPEVAVPLQANFGTAQDVIDPGATLDVDWDAYLWPAKHGGFTYYNNTYFLYYQGSINEDVNGEGVHRSIGVATSPDGETWTKYANNPIITYNPGGSSYTQEGAFDPIVLVVNGVFHMWYGVAHGTGGGLVDVRVRYCNSTDGINWSNDTQVYAVTGQEYVPTAAMLYNGVWSVYVIGDMTGGRGPLRRLYGNAPNNLTSISLVLSGYFRSGAKFSRLADNKFMLGLDNYLSEELYIINPASPDTIGPIVGTINTGEDFPDTFLDYNHSRWARINLEAQMPYGLIQRFSPIYRPATSSTPAYLEGYGPQPASTSKSAYLSGTATGIDYPHASIININHETGNLSQYTSTVTNGGILTVTAAAALARTGYGLSCPTTASPIYGKKDLAADDNANQFRVRFYMDRNGTTWGSGSSVEVLQLIRTVALGNPILRVFVENAAGTYRMVFRAYRFGGNTLSSTVNLSTGQHRYEFLVTRSSADNVSDGSVRWWIDDAEQTAVTGIDNYTEASPLRSVVFGLVGASGTTGTMYFDELIINNTGRSIGKYPYQHAYLKANIATSTSKSAYLSGPNDGVSDSTPAFLQGQANAISNLPAYLLATDTAAASLPGYLSGRDLDNSSAPCYLRGLDSAAASIPAFTSGADTLTNQVHSFAQGIAADVSSRPAYTRGSRFAPAPAIININHETGDLSQYTSTVTDGGDLSVTADAALVGTGYGLSFLLDDANELRARKNITKRTTFRLRFYVDINSLTMATDDDFTFHSLQQEGSPYGTFVGADIMKSAGGYRLRLTAFRDGGSQAYASFADITDAPHCVEYLVTRATTDTSNDGTFYWWVDRAYQGGASNIDNYNYMGDVDWRIDFHYIHYVGNPTGTFYIDEIVANDTGEEIGPYPYQHAFVKGQADGITSAHAYLEGASTGTDTSDSIPAYLSSQDTASSNVGGYTHGKADGQSSQPAVLFGRSTANASTPVYLRGQSNTSGNVAGYLQSNAQAATSIAAYLEGGANSGLATQSAYLKGRSSGTGSKSAYLHGQAIAPAPAIVNINHETGDFSQYNVAGNEGGGNLTINSQAALAGTGYGMRFQLGGSNMWKAYDKLPASTTGRIRARFYFDPNGLTASDNSYTQIFYGSNAQNSAYVFGVNFSVVSESYKLTAYIFKDDGSSTGTGTHTISDAPHYIEIDLVRSSSSTANDGKLDFYIDGQLEHTLSDIDNYDRFYQYVRTFVCFNTNVDTKSGVAYIDEVIVNDTGLPIGPYPYQHAFLKGQALATSSKSVYLAGANPPGETNDSIHAYLSAEDTQTTSRSAFLRGGLETNGQQPVYLRGALDQSGNLPAYLQASAEETALQSAYLAGQNDGLALQQAFLKGEQHDQSNQAVFLQGSNDANASLSVYLNGQSTASGTLPAYLYPNANAADQSAAYLTGQEGQATAVQTAFLSGLDTTQSSLPALLAGGLNVSHALPGYLLGSLDQDTAVSAFVHGRSPSWNNQAAYLRGKNQEISEISSFSRGSAIGENSRSAFLRGSLSATNTRPVYLTGFAVATSLVHAFAQGYSANESVAPAYIAGKDVASSNQPGYLTGVSPASLSSCSAFLKGVAHSVNQERSFLAGSAEATSFLSVYLPADAKESSRSASYLIGKSSVVASHSAFLGGYAHVVSTAIVYLAGESSTEAQHSAWLAGQSLAETIQAAWTAGQVQPLASQASYLQGKLDVQTSQSAFVLGGIGEISQISAFTDGLGNILEAQRHAYLWGAIYNYHMQGILKTDEALEGNIIIEYNVNGDCTTEHRFQGTV